MFVTRSARPRLRALLILILGTFAPAVAPAADDGDAYKMHFGLELGMPGETATASVTVKQSRDLLRRVRFKAPDSVFTKFTGGGKISRDGDYVIWIPPATGGSVTYQVKIDKQRKNGGYDALVTKDWAIFRADRVFPPAAVTQIAGAVSTSGFSIVTPTGWVVETPYLDQPDGTFDVTNAARLFDRPTGWVIAGRLGIRRDMIDNQEVAIAAPIGAGAQRLGMLALLRWNLPLLFAEIETVPPKLTVVSAAAPMWRGALSAPNSMFVHADRPLISENATSTLMHEVVHVLMPVPSALEHDWIDEGIAEFAALKILRRSDSISSDRYKATLAKFKSRGAGVDSLLTSYSAKEITARAVTIFYALDREIRKNSDKQHDIFDLIRALMREPEPVDHRRLCEIATELMNGKKPDALKARNLPGL